VTHETAFDFERVVLTDVFRSFGRRRALNRVSVTFVAGEIVGLLGPNGAGKSTLLGLLATLIRPTSGELRYGEKTATNGGAALRGRLGFLSHELQVYPELSARENLEFFAGLYRLDEPPRRAAAALDRAGLAGRADDPVAGFSRGMRQRLALERALLHGPRLVLLDEPFTGLDEASGRALAARLRELRDDRRIVVLATHDLDMVDGLLDRAIMLRDGRTVTLDETGGSLRERYRKGLGA
jgi:heme exporter protein A